MRATFMDRVKQIYCYLPDVVCQLSILTRVNYKKEALNSQLQVLKFASITASSATKTGRHDIAEILLKVA
jgi:hypothetical protein